MVFSIIAILLFIYKYWLLHQFTFHQIDSDQTVMWYGLKEISQGNFREPCFYGQSYNSMLESILALPGYWIGFEPHHALPVTTMILSVIPFYCLGYVTFKKISPLSGILVLCTAFIFRIEYDIISTLPRGFVTGLFVSIFILPAILEASSIRIFIAGFFFVFSYTLNPNSILFTIPLIFILTMTSELNRRMIFYAFSGIFVGFILHLLIKNFYWIHPEYDLHSLQMNYEFSNIFKGIFSTDDLFHDVSPIFWNAHFLILPFFLISGIIFFIYKNKLAGMVCLLILALIIASFGMDKTYDGSHSVFFSYTRMYLAIPLLFALIFYFIPVRSIIFTIFFGFTALTITSVKLLKREGLAKHLLDKPGMLPVIEYKRMKNDCINFKQLLDKYNVDIVLAKYHWMRDFYAYGCTVCIENFPTIIIPDYDRRVWLFKEVESTNYENILIIDLNVDYSKKDSTIEKLHEMEGYYLIRNNNKNVFDLMTALDIEYRKF